MFRFFLLLVKELEMFIPTKNRQAIMTELFTEGVLVAKKDIGKHMKLEATNLEIRNLMKTFVALKYVEEQFVWSHYYWVLTDAGIEYLRGKLYLKPNVCPNTMKPSAREALAEGDSRGERRGGRGGGRGRGYGGGRE